LRYSPNGEEGHDAPRFFRCGRTSSLKSQACCPKPQACASGVTFPERTASCLWHSRAARRSSSSATASRTVGGWARSGRWATATLKQFRDLLVAREPAKDVTIINKGISGHTVVDLRNRWTDDVLREEARLALDQDRHQRPAPDAREHPGSPCRPNCFAQTYDEILARTTKALPKCRILLIDPFYISTDRRAGVVPRAGARRVAEVPFATVAPDEPQVSHASRPDARDLSEAAQVSRAGFFCGEPVHPNLSGHLVIAEAVYEALSR